MGLWAGVKAERLGISTLLVDRSTPGNGASGGVLGALMAHAPDRWNDKKQFQLDALRDLPGEIERLESETGLSAGYRRCGRLIPLQKAHQRDNALGQAREAVPNWATANVNVDTQTAPLSWSVIDQPPVPGWPAADQAPHGLVHDTLAARVSPRRLIAMLEASLEGARHVRVRRMNGVSQIDSGIGRAVLEDGTIVDFDHVILAAGPQSFPLLARMLDLPAPPGQAVKGQAALLRLPAGSPSLVDRPLVYRDGVYVVPHDDGTVAIGSTSENSFTDPVSTDERLDVLLAEARVLVPLLDEAEVIERWAGLRPKAIGRDPMIGVDPRHPRLIALTGGFKVSFGIAHRMADAALALIGGQGVPVPDSFLLSTHLELAARKG